MFLKKLLLNKLQFVFSSLAIGTIVLAIGAAAFGSRQQSGLQEVGLATTPMVRRIGVLKFENGTSYPEISDRLSNAISRDIRSVPDVQLVELDLREENSCEFDFVQRGEYPIELLASTWRQYHADTLMFARVNNYCPFPPLSVGITIHLVDTRDATLVGTLNHSWSLSDPTVLGNYRSYLCKKLQRPVDDQEILLSSPRFFCDFVSGQVAQALNHLPTD